MASSEQSNWLDTVIEYFRKFCWCCPLPRKQSEEYDIEENQSLNPKDEEAKNGEQCTPVCLESLYIMENMGHVFDYASYCSTSF